MLVLISTDWTCADSILWGEVQLCSTLLLHKFPNMPIFPKHATQLRRVLCNIVKSKMLLEEVKLLFIQHPIGLCSSWFGDIRFGGCSRNLFRPLCLLGHFAIQIGFASFATFWGIEAIDLLNQFLQLVVLDVQETGYLLVFLKPPNNSFQLPIVNLAILPNSERLEQIFILLFLACGEILVLLLHLLESGHHCIGLLLQD